MNKLKLTLLSVLFFASSLLLLDKSYSEVSDSEVTKASFTASEWVEGAYDSLSVTVSIKPEILLYTNASKNKLGFILNNVSDFDSFKYEIKYTHQTEGGPLAEVIEGAINNPTGNSTVIEEWMVLGSCTTGGTCTYFNGMPQIDLSVELIKSGVTQNTLTDTLNF